MATKKSKKQENQQLSFEVAQEQLEEIVERLEQGDLSLDGSLSSYEQGIKLLRQCYSQLEAAERKIELLSGFDADGNPVTEPFE